MNRAVNIIAMRPSGQIVLQLRDEKVGILNPGVWALPGGTANDGESISDAARREFKEETGIVATDLYLTGVHVFADQQAVVSFCVTVLDDEALLMCLEGQKMIFFEPREVGGLAMAPGYRKQIIINLLKYYFTVHGIRAFFLCLFQLAFSNRQNEASSHGLKSNQDIRLGMGGAGN